MKARKLALSVIAVVLGMAVSALGSAPAQAAEEYRRAGAFGAPCSSKPCGEGQLDEPSGVAVNASDEPLVQPFGGDVYVIDTGDARVERFSASGQYLGQFDGAGDYEAEGKAATGPATPSGALSLDGTEDANGIAVDSSTDPLDQSSGDVYVADVGHDVIDKFSSVGRYEGQLTGACPQPGICAAAEVIPFGGLYGVAVDPEGNVWVYSPSTVDEFGDTGETLRSFSTGRGTAPGMGVDASGDVYAMVGSSQVAEFVNQREFAEFGAAGSTALAVNQATAEVFTDTGHSVERFGPVTTPAPEPLASFGEPSESYGIAVDGAVGTQPLYASERSGDDVVRFENLVYPDVSTGSASGVSETTATIRGTVTPEGPPLTECQFEYGTETAYGQSVPCAQTPAEINALSKGGTVPVQVSAELTAIQVRTAYDFRLSAANANGAERGGNETLYTAGPPTVEGESVVAVGSTEATIAATIDPGGEPSTYRLEYGTSNVEERTTEEFALSAAQSPIAVRVSLSGLSASSSYYFRLLAANARGTATGQEMTLVTSASQVASVAGESTCPNRTFAGFQEALPDCRAYELVSAAEDDTNVPPYEEDGSFTTGEVTGERGGRYRAATDGEAVAYMGGPVSAGVGGDGKTGNGNGNNYIAVRGPQGWQASDVTPPLNSAYGASFSSFSPDLSVAFFESDGPEVNADPSAPAECADKTEGQLYSYTTSGFHALRPTAYGTSVCYLEPAGVSADDAHFLVQSYGAYTATAKQGAEYADENLYDSVGGVLYQVNILPNGEPESQPDATVGERFGEPADGGTLDGDLDGAVSADGSRVFWSSLEGSGGQARPKALYVRESDTGTQSPIGPHGECTIAGDACTVLIAEGGEFAAASSNGSVVYYLDEGRLFRFDVETGERTALSGEGMPVAGSGDLSAGSTRVTGLAMSSGHFVVGELVLGVGVPAQTYITEVGAGSLTLSQPGTESGTGVTLTGNGNVQGVIGASEDGSYLYFVAGVVLSGQNGEGRSPIAGQPNLYMWHDGIATFIATLSAKDEVIHSRSGGKQEIGDWQINPGLRTAEVAPGGKTMAFMSFLPLTGYGSEVTYRYSEQGEPHRETIAEVFVYEAESGRMFCASCNPSGAPPTEHTRVVQLEAVENETSVAVSSDASFMPRWINERQGTQVYFMTYQPLVVDDTNGLQDVYEWQSDGSGGCQQARGCITLLSSADPFSNAYFVDASADGGDVFLTSRAQLVPEAYDETLKLYDARVDGGSPHPSLACTGTGCQGIPPAPPIFETPASVTFNGVGNFEPAAPAVKPKAKPQPKKRTAKKCGKGRHRRHGRCVKLNKRGRAKPAAKRSSTTGRGR